jgi:hypothetical protein
MEFSKFSQTVAKEIDAQFTEYDASHSVFVVPLADGRYQTVIAKLMDHPKFNKQVVRVTSKVCYTSEEIDYVAVLSSSEEYVNTHFIVEDDVLKVEASFFYDLVNTSSMRDVIKEVASIADDWELKITGVDTF